MEHIGIQRGWRKAVRTILQLIASGSITAVIGIAVGGLNPTVAGLVLAVFQVIVTFAQNTLESQGTIPVLLPTEPPPPVAPPADLVIDNPPAEPDAPDEHVVQTKPAGGEPRRVRRKSPLKH